MFELLTAGFLSLWLNKADVQVMQSVNWSSWLDASWIRTLGQPIDAPDPIAELMVKRHLSSLEALAMPQSGQGVWVQAGNEVVASHQGDVPLSAASLTKIATTLVAIETWGPDHQFATQISAVGSIENGVLQGDLVVQGDGDPLFVWEEAIALGNALNQAGIRRVTGNLVIAGNFSMNFETDPAIAGSLLKQGLDANRWSREATAQYRTLPPDTARPRVVIEGAIQAMSPTDAANRVTAPLIRHQSLPLADILKAQNVYSNNMIAEMLTNELGGAGVVAQKAAEIARIPAGEIQLVNGSGLGVENRISPRAICAMLIEMQRYLESRQMNVADLFPVIGIDRGTLRGRRLPVGAAVKTGTLNTVSSLAGVIPTRDRGLVWFAIINMGEANLYTLHGEQDILVQGLQQRWGAPSLLPADLQPGDRLKQEISRLGAPSRNAVN